MRFITSVFTASLFCLLTACSSPEPVLIDTPQGQVQAEVSEAGIANFKGLPYAQPPVGDMRWRAPGPAPVWDGVREANAFSATCMQSTEGTGDLIERVIQGHGLSRFKRFLIRQVASRATAAPVSEDCLYLNVRTPDVGGSAPVMVWIHGGGHQFGSADFDLYQGDALAENGVVLVTINYRLNVFGYMAHPMLSDEQGSSGNYGLRDQMAALQWVQDNIAAYGGDPEAVTVFGESAGASSIAALIAAPDADGLFDRAILQSGEATRTLVALEEAETLGETIIASLPDDTPLTVDNLRGLAASSLLKAAGAEDRSASLRPIGDGVLLARSVPEVLASGEFRAVPAIVGYNSDEAGIFYEGPQSASLLADMDSDDAGEQLARLQAGYGEAAGSAIARLYGIDGRMGLDEAARDVMGDEMFGVSARFILERLEGSGADVWAYAFTRVPPSQTQTLGAFHSAEIPFLFDTHERALGLSDADEALTRAMIGYWTNFAKTGDPNGAGLPDWPRYGDTHWMEFTANNGRDTGMITNYREEKLDALSEGLDPKLRTDRLEH